MGPYPDLPFKALPVSSWTSVTMGSISTNPTSHRMKILHFLKKRVYTKCGDFSLLSPEQQFTLHLLDTISKWRWLKGCRLSLSSVPTLRHPNTASCYTGDHGYPQSTLKQIPEHSCKYLCAPQTDKQTKPEQFYH